MIKLVCLILLLATLETIAHKIECEENEVQSAAACNVCENTCRNPEKSLGCNGPKTHGCVCKNGYLRNAENECVLPHECDVCGTNEIFSLCEVECQNTCEEPNYEDRCTRTGCKHGCICRKGFLRNSKGLCVHPNSCHLTNCSDPNAEYSPCGNVCPVRCDNINHPVCDRKKCKPSKGGGCRCKDGYVENSNRRCVLPSECVTCQANEVYRCGSPCDTKCATLGEPCEINKSKCIYQCYCIKDYARDSNNVCIPVNQCPPKVCPDDPNAIQTPCGDPCPKTCLNKDHVGPMPCLNICQVNGCKCKPGYVIGPNNKCILKSACPANVCPTNEVFVTCIKPCPLELSCCRYKSKSICHPPTNYACRSGCVCAPGYYRQYGGRCVKLEDCCDDPNAVFKSCPNPCPATCENPICDKCYKKCPTYGCECNPGYVQTSIYNTKCIKLSDCPKQ